MAKDSPDSYRLILAVLLVVFVAVLVVFSNSFTGYVTFRPFVSVNPSTHTALTSYLGGEPIIDGQVTALDKWDEAGTVTMPYERGNVKIASKHDGKYLYFLVQWDDESPAWNDGINFYFEDDGYTHDHSLDGTNDYLFRNLVAGCNVIAGGYWTQGANDWTPAGAEFNLNCGWERGRGTGKWTVETRHLLSDISKGDKTFSISSSKPETLGFAVVNFEGNMPGGADGSSWSWPVDKNAGNSYGTNPAEPATWGDLKIIWQKKPLAKPVLKKR